MSTSSQLNPGHLEPSKAVTPCATGRPKHHPSALLESFVSLRALQSAFYSEPTSLNVAAAKAINADRSGTTERLTLRLKMIIRIFVKTTVTIQSVYAAIRVRLVASSTCSRTTVIGKASAGQSATAPAKRRKRRQERRSNASIDRYWRIDSADCHARWLRPKQHENARRSLRWKRNRPSEA